MRVALVTMAFPHPSETFATNFVHELLRHDVSLQAYCMRPPEPTSRRLLTERGLNGLHISSNGVWPTLRGTGAALLRPVLLARSLTWLIRTSAIKPVDFFASLLLLPRAFDIFRLIAREQPDVVHMFWGHFPAIVGHLVQQGLPAVVTSISINAYDLEREYRGTRSVALAADVIRTHAHVNRGRLATFIGVPEDRIEVIYNGVDIARLDALRGTGDARLPRSIVAVGRLTRSKGMGDVLEAFTTLRRRWPDATLTILGDGPERERLVHAACAAGVEDGVRFLGHVAHDDVIREMWRSEVVILMSQSRGERLPNVVKEGMACGCVCVTTPTPGIEELVEHGVTGFVVPMSAPQAACDVIDAVFAGRVDVAAMSRRADAHVRETFDLTQTAPSFRGLWARALARRALRSPP